MTDELKRPALIVVDMQNGFIDENGSMCKAGFDVSPLKGIVKNVVRLVKTARSHEIPVIYTKQTFRKDYVDGGKVIERWPSLKETGGLIEGSWDAQIINELSPLDGDYIIIKRRFSAFYNTDLEILLRNLGTQTLIVIGVTTRVCVESTVRDAQFRDFSVVVVSDCTSAYDKNLHEASLRNIEFAFGNVVSMNEALSSMKNLKW